MVLMEGLELAVMEIFHNYFYLREPKVSPVALLFLTATFTTTYIRQYHKHFLKDKLC
jgi:hypothetical protein